MKKNLYLTAAASVLALGLAAPANADVFIVAHVTKNKDIFVFEEIFKFKNVTIVVDSFNHVFDSAAEATAIVNARNAGGEVNGFANANTSFIPVVDVTNNPGADYDIFLTAIINNSVNDNAGVVGVNQDVGNMANQGNVVALSVTGRPYNPNATPTPEVFGATSNPAIAHAEAAVDQVNTGNTVYNSQFLSAAGNPAASVPNVVATIAGSVNGNAGVVGVNQNAGNFANQHNVVAMAIAFEGVVALTEALLGQVNTGHSVIEIETIKLGTIVGTGNGNSGIVGINQSAGNNNNQAHVVSLAALTSHAVVGVPFGGGQ